MRTISCAGGELFEHVASRRATLTEATAATMARSLLQYLAHVHGLGVAHMDIKPENIMFDCEGPSGALKVGSTHSAQDSRGVWGSLQEWQATLQLLQQQLPRRQVQYSSSCAVSYNAGASGLHACLSAPPPHLAAASLR